jgi:hypothetical protein
MPEIKISHPIVMLDLTDVPKDSAIALRNLLGQHFKARDIDVHVGYSEADGAIRIVVKSVNESMSECNALIHDTIGVWLNAPMYDSISTKKGRTIRW